MATYSITIGSSPGIGEMAIGSTFKIGGFITTTEMGITGKSVEMTLIEAPASSSAAPYYPPPKEGGSSRRAPSKSELQLQIEREDEELLSFIHVFLKSENPVALCP
jgi:hypothetical protein